MNGRLNVDKMDTINFLLTEVSLGLLGNDFFDIHGNCMDSLNTLVSKSSSKNIACPAGDAPLVHKLKLSESNLLNTNKHKSKTTNSEPYKKPDKLRRLSHSDMRPDQMLPADIPMKSQSAKIRARRSTCIGNRFHLVSENQKQSSTSDQFKVIRLPANGVVQPLVSLEGLQQELKIGMLRHVWLSFCKQKINAFNDIFPSRDAKHGGKLEERAKESGSNANGWRYMQQCRKCSSHIS